LHYFSKRDRFSRVNLKNYTSSTPANLTISYIESYLAECEVEGITKQYAHGVPVALAFHVNEDGKTFTIRLPAKVEEVWEYLWRDYVTSRVKPKKTKDDFKDQAARTAWKIQQDWVQVQMSLIKLKQAKVVEVFMAFVWDGEQTYYQALKSGGFKQLPQSTS
jgi:hypothetical protein